MTWNIYIYITFFLTNIYHINYTHVGMYIYIYIIHGAFHPAFHDDKLEGGAPPPAGGWATGCGIKRHFAVAGGEISDITWVIPSEIGILTPMNMFTYLVYNDLTLIITPVVSGLTLAY